MHTFIFFIVICGGFGLLSADISSSTIESDLDEIMKLSQDFQQYSPRIAHQITEATCQMIAQCCPQFQSTFISMSLIGNTTKLADQCFGSKGSSKYLANVLSCSPLLKITALITKEQFTRYWSIIQNESIQDKEDVQLILESCTNEELHSIACDVNKFDLQKSCERKVLEKLAKQGDEVYQTKVQRSKEHYTKLVAEFKKEFHN